MIITNYEKNQISITINTPILTIEELTVREDKGSGKRVQFILKNNSNSKFKLKPMELKLFDKRKNYIGHELCCIDKPNDLVLKNQELLLEFDSIELEDIYSAEIKIIAKKWFEVPGYILAILIITFIISSIINK